MAVNRTSSVGEREPLPWTAAIKTRDRHLLSELAEAVKVWGPTGGEVKVAVEREGGVEC